jgi:hypothetical protein
MNWAIVLCGGVTILATGYYFLWGRKQYKPPRETLENYIARSRGDLDDDVTVVDASELAEVEKKSG